jgi:hypothetical protein
MKKLFLVLLFLSPNLIAQNKILQEQGSWYSVNNKFKISDKFFFGNTFQMRRVDFADKVQVVLLKPSMNFRPSRKFSMGIGYTYFDSFPNGAYHASIKKNETRVWQYFTYHTFLGKSSFNHRFLFEERFKDVIDETQTPHVINSTSYAQRFRYRATMAFNLFRLKSEKFMLGKISNELRIRFKNGLSLSDFDQNNFGTYLGYQLYDNSKLWLGYGRDIAKVNSDLFVSYHLLHLTWTYDFNLKKGS